MLYCKPILPLWTSTFRALRSVCSDFLMFCMSPIWLHGLISEPVPLTASRDMAPAHLGPCRTGRRTCSSRSDRGVTAAPPGWTAAAAGWTGSRPRWGSWAWWGRCAGRCRRTSTCGPSACRTGRRWQRHRGNTASKLRKEEKTGELISNKEKGRFWKIKAGVLALDHANLCQQTARVERNQ